MTNSTGPSPGDERLADVLDVVASIDVPAAQTEVSPQETGTIAPAVEPIPAQQEVAPKAGTDWRAVLRRVGAFLKKYFWPNQAISKTTLQTLALMQFVVLVVVWVRADSPVFPGPAEVWTEFKRLWTEYGFARELFTSFKLNVESLARATLISLPIAYLYRFNFFKPIVGLITKGRFLGLLGLTFFFTVYIGGGHALKVWLLVFGMAVFLSTSMVDTVRQITQAEYDYPRTLRMGEWQVLWYTVIRGTLDKAIDCIRQNAAIGWTMLTMVEGISRSEGGVGAMLLNENKHLRLAAVLAIQISIFLLGLLQDVVIGWMKNILCPHVKFVEGSAK